MSTGRPDRWTALVVVQSADAAEAVAADDHITDAEGPFLDQHGASTPRPSDSDASRQVPVAGRVGSALSSCSSAIVSSVASKSGRPWPVAAEVLMTSVSPPHSEGVEPLLRQLAKNLVDVGGGVDVRQVDLVERHHDRHFSRLGVGDGLDGLRHDAVVGGDHEHDDVGHIGALRTHRGERLMARRVHKGDGAAVGFDLVGADMLGNAATLGLDDVRLANAVQQRGLSVVDVAQDGDYRGA